MTKKKGDRLSVIHRKEIIWLQWYFLKDKKQPNKTILESKIENAMLSSHHFQAKKYLVIKNATEILKRYPTAKQSEKLELEIEKLKSQLTDTQIEDETITIADKWEVEKDESS